METVRLPIPTPRALVRPRSRLLSHVHPLAPRRAVAVFITDTMNNAIRRMRIDDPNRYAVDTVWSRYSSSYAESSIVCDGGVCGSVPGNVSGLWSPMAVAVWDVDGMFALLIADTDNHRIVKLSPADPDDRSKTPWVLDHFAGRGERGFVNGAAYMASFRYPHAVAVCKGYVMDLGSLSSIRACAK